MVDPFALSDISKLKSPRNIKLSYYDVVLSTTELKSEKKFWFDMVKTHFPISQNVIKLFTQVYETFLFIIDLKSIVINKRYGQKWDIKMWGNTDTKR